MPPFVIPQARPRVQRAPLPGVRQQIRTSPADFGAIEAGLISDIGEQITGVAGSLEQRDIREQRITLARQKEEARLQEEKDKMYANAGKLEFQNTWIAEKNEFLGTTRLGADGTTIKATEWFNKTKDNLMANAKTDRERELLDAKLGPEFTKILQKVTDHEKAQLTLAKTEQNDSLYANAVMQAGQPDSNEIDILDAELTIRDSLNVKTQDMDAETAKKVRAEGMSAFHESVINGKIDSNLEFAKSYSKEVKDELSPEAQVEMQEKLDKESIVQESQQQADKIILEEVTTDKDNLSEQLEKARKIKDSEVRDATVARIKTRHAERAQEKKEGLVKENDDITGKILNAPTWEKAKELANTAPTNEDVKKHLAHANSRWKEKTSKVVTNPVIEERVNHMVTTGEIRTQEQYIRETNGEMSSQDLQKGLKFLAQGGEVGNIQEGKLRSKFTEIMGIVPKEDPFLYKLSRDFIVDQIQATGKPPTDTNIDEWMGQALLTGIETESIKGTGIFGFLEEERPVTLVEALKRRIPFTTEITEDEKRLIVTDMQTENAGRPPGQRLIINAETVERVFLRDEGFTEEQINRIMGL
jgi:hypothetical protein